MSQVRRRDDCMQSKYISHCLLYRRRLCPATHLFHSTQEPGGISQLLKEPCLSRSARGRSLAGSWAGRGWRHMSTKAGLYRRTHHADTIRSREAAQIQAFSHCRTYSTSRNHKPIVGKALKVYNRTVDLCRPGNTDDRDAHAISCNSTGTPTRAKKYISMHAIFFPSCRCSNFRIRQYGNFRAALGHPISSTSEHSEGL